MAATPWSVAAWLGAALVAGATATSTWAQTSPPGFAATEEVSVVNVEAKAFTADGKPVTDLRREDFRLYENGRLVPITHYFSSSDGAAAATGGSSANSPGAAAEARATPLHLVVLVDDAHLGTSHRTLALRYVSQFVGKLGEGSRAMVASYNGGLNVLAEFDTPPSRAVEALEAEALAAGAGVHGDLDLRSTLEAIRERQQRAIENPLDTPCGRELLDYARGYAEAKQAEVEQLVRSLGLLVDTLAAVPGRKLLLLVSDGFPLRAGAEVFGYVALLCDGSGARQGIQWAIEDTSQPAEQLRPGEAALAATAYDAADELAAVTARANAAEVTLYTLQATGLQLLGSADVSQAFRFFPPQFDSDRRLNYQDPLTALAADTGGRALLERNDYLEALAGIGEDVAHYYSLGFTPAARTAGGTSKVRLEVTRPGVRLRYRTRFQLRSRDDDATARVRAALLLGLADNPMALALATSMGSSTPAAAPAAGVRRVRVGVPIKALTCLDEGAARRCLITVFLGAQRVDGTFTPVRSRSLPLSVAPGQGAPAEYVYEVEMPATPPLRRISAVVRDELGGQLSAVTTAPEPAPATHTAATRP